MNLRDAQAVVEFDPKILKPDSIASIISDMGYTSAVQKEFKHSSAFYQPPLTSEHHKSTVIHVEGMVCINCAQIIESNLRKRKGIEHISVSNEEKVAHVLYDTNVLSIENICSAIEDLGFEATSTSAQVDDVFRPTPIQSAHDEQSCVIRIEGMTCSSCVEKIESKLRELEAIESIQVRLQEKEARIAYNAGRTTPKEIAALICDLGYTVTDVDGRCVLYCAIDTKFCNP